MSNRFSQLLDDPHALFEFLRVSYLHAYGTTSMLVSSGKRLSSSGSDDDDV